MIATEQQIIIDNRILTAENALLIHEHVTSVTFDNCASDEWLLIGYQLASLPQLYTLRLLQCNSSNSILEGLVASSSLLRL